MAKKYRAAPRRSNVTLIFLVLAAVGLLVVCGVVVALLRNASSTSGKPSTREVVLNVAYSPEKQEIFAQRVAAFNATNAKLPNGKRVQVAATSVTPEDMVNAANENTYQAISPDSSIWLAEIDRRWVSKDNPDATLIGESARYMISPVVVAMWRDVAVSLGYPGKELGWQDLLKVAAEKPDFKWSHPSTSTASGLLATLAEFYAGAGLTRGLTEQAATAKATTDYVARLEKTVKHYGEGELAVMQQIEKEGRNYLDAFIVQEQMVVRYSQRNPGQAGLSTLVAIYPREGTLWEDHPLALLENAARTDEERLAYGLFKRFLLNPESQQAILKAGYRPTDLSVRLDQGDSPIKTANGVDPTRPYTTLQVPGPSVIAVVKDAWQTTKRHTNIYLIADVSGSMQGAKLRDAQAALKTFLTQVEGNTERVGLITFATNVSEVAPLTQLGTGRAQLAQAIDGLAANGNTALLDAVDLGLTKLQDLNDTERINAIVVMTDGKENQSRTRLAALTDRLRKGKPGLQVVVFCIAYGGDADIQMLESISGATGGFTRRGDPETIKSLYKTLSTYF